MERIDSEIIIWWKCAGCGAQLGISDKATESETTCETCGKHYLLSPSWAYNTYRKPAVQLVITAE